MSKHHPQKTHSLFYVQIKVVDFRVLYDDLLVKWCYSE